MSSKKFQLSVVTTALLSAFAVQANDSTPMYGIISVDVSSDIQYSFNEVYGVAIQPATQEQLEQLDPSDAGLGCFAMNTQTDVDCQNDFALAGETRIRVDSVSMLNEVPFAMDASFGYIEDYDSFKSYCYRERLYATCESWSETYWNAWRNVLNGVENIKSFVEGGEFKNTDFDNHITSLNPDGSAVGMQSNAAADDVYAPRRKITSVPSLTTSEGVEEYRAWAQLDVVDETTASTTSYVVGSSSRIRENTNGNHFISNASVWTSVDGSDFEFTRINWPSNKEKDGERLAQGSIRDIAQTEDGIYAVGYNTYDNSNNYYEASVFAMNSEGTFVNNSDVSGAKAKNNDGDVVYSNTQLVSINNNGIALGESKLYGSRPENGAAANKPFIVEDITNPTAKYLQDYGQSLFFTGVGADLGAINNFNELVGSIDATQARENDGQPRRNRGFIYTVPNQDTSSRASLFRNKAWLLDDLTNDGDVNGNNNKYRIISASDINDAGVISATAIYCADGYDDTSHNSYCGDRAGVEQVVAVKLVPNQLIDEDNDGEGDLPEIISRSVNDPAVERQGAGFGWMFLVALGFLGFRRK
ncbi:DUF3466 family protein [Vibrio sp. FNV 38]|nr:DUF3466 family protein [Vibrio sp. FNV 38]